MSYPVYYKMCVHTFLQSFVAIQQSTLNITRPTAKKANNRDSARISGYGSKHSNKDRSHSNISRIIVIGIPFFYPESSKQEVLGTLIYSLLENEERCLKTFCITTENILPVVDNDQYVLEAEGQIILIRQKQILSQSFSYYFTFLRLIDCCLFNVQ